MTTVCASGQFITATVTVANTTGVPTAKQSRIEVTVIARKVKPLKQRDIERHLGSGSNSLRARPPFYLCKNNHLQNQFPDDFLCLSYQRVMSCKMWPPVDQVFLAAPR
jgi:hypothetical protein